MRTFTATVAAAAPTDMGAVAPTDMGAVAPAAAPPAAAAAAAAVVVAPESGGDNSTVTVAPAPWDNVAMAGAGKACADGWSVLGMAVVLLLSAAVMGL